MMLDTVTSVQLILKFSFVGLMHKYWSLKEEAELRRKTSELETNRHEEFRFISCLSHSSKTSLNGVVNYLYFMEQEETVNTITPTKKSNYGLLNQCCDTILSKLNSIVNYVEAKIKRSNPVMMKRVNIRNFVNYLFTIAKSPTISESQSIQVTHRISFSPNVPKYVEIDQDVFSGIFVNLATNSLKYCQKGLIDVYVCIVEINGTQQLSVQIKDTGIGIANEKLKSLFVPLKTISDHETLELKPESFSLGLTIVKSLIERMKGTIEITSEGIGKGTTSKFTIPFLSSEEVSYSPSADINRKITSSSIPTVFVVDCNSINRRLMKYQLEGICKSANIIECVDGLDCLTKVEFERIKIEEENSIQVDKNTKKKKFCPIILTDLNMRNMSGQELCHTFRTEIEGGDSFVISAISAAVLNKKRLLSKFGFDFVNAKPITFEDMKTLFGKCVALQTKRQRTEEPKVLDQKHEVERFGFMSVVLNNSSETDLVGNEKHFAAMLDEEKNTIDDSFYELLKIGLSMQIAVLIVDFLAFIFIPRNQFADNWTMVQFACLFAVVDNFLLIFGMKLLGFSSRVAKTLRFFCFFLVFANGMLLSPMKDMRNYGIIGSVNIIQQLELISDFYFGMVGWFLWVALALLWEYNHLRFDFSDNYTGGRAELLVFGELGSLIAFVFIIFDHSAQYIKFSKERKNKLKEMVVCLENLAETHQMTISKISHDLIPPASALLLYTEELIKNRRKKKPSEKYTDMENDLLFSVHDLNFAMKNFIICCKIRYNKVTTRNDYRLKVLDISNYVSLLVSILSNGRIKLIENSELGDLCFQDTILVDKKKVMLVIGNLVSNASLHSGTSMIGIRYFLREEEKLGIEIRDYGKGIESLDAILEECERLDHFLPQKMSKSGNVFGIKVSKYLACRSLEGGNLLIENKESGGVKCSFEFSFGRVEEDEEKVVEEEIEGEEEEEDIVRVKALILDDVVINRRVAEKHLKEYGIFETNIVKTGTVDECLEVLEREEQFELFLCDFYLSGTETAIDVVNAIQNNENITRPKHIVLCTGRNDLRVGDSTCKDYFEDILEKPFSFDEVRSVLDELVILL